ncbi:ADP-ribosylglycohydrolase family protein [Streptomyces albofaciens JCM 4342]|uniref:ADP-ribosylglycohydrolase family protein n=1 Tax=Streptomyces albofaciens TaxID=66866 RepID=UPI00123A66B9|nr:ADP-ribosylglycohydrolase family protein [Streptomyces albofaciens]KAA6222706.1 ADP-ribosylglycohydrolase family protein [Streptomyces albofaciens JCM 4342]
MASAATGSLIGLALGDALGYPTEFLDVSAILARCGPWRELALPAPAYVTDDTQMTIALGRALRTAVAAAGGVGGLDAAHLVPPVRERYVEWWRSPDNNRAPGNTCLRACQLLSEPERPWVQAGQIGSKGCGANMRVAPVGLVPELSPEQRSGAAQLQSALTHGHPTALAASDLTAYAVHVLAQGARPDELPGLLRSYAVGSRTVYRDDWLGELWRHAQDPSPEHFIARGWDDCLGVLDRLDAALRAPDPEADPCLATGAGWIAEEALATGLLCFLLFPDEPLTALRRAACSSGDSDSIACLTGAFAGARLGAGAWPEEWAERIEYRDQLLALGKVWDV